MLDAHDLACIRGGRTVFKGLDFSLGEGEVLALHGANGTGKSTLIRLLAGFLSPALGKISWAGVDIRSNLAEHRARLHYVGHADGIKNLLSVRENLAFTCALNGAGNDALERALRTFDLESLVETPGRFLSSGQRRRLSLARLVAGERPIWLLDEPGVGLDAASRRRLENAIDQHRREGGITVLATHGDVQVTDTRLLEFSS
ncbi:MAG: heme ABC exporter ATP-binding protein CcmA [Geminicoccaceae bacterium]